MAVEAPASSEAGDKAEEREKPALYFVYCTRKADKWKARYQRRKKRDEDAEAAAEAAEAAAKQARKGKKRKKVAEDEQDEQDGQDGKDGMEGPEEPESKERDTQESTKADEDKPWTRKQRRQAQTAAKAAAEAEEKAKQEAHDKQVEEELSVSQKVEEAIHPKGFFSDMRFDDLAICEPLKKSLRESSFDKLTEIQSKAIPHLLAGKDVLAAAKTGSGKTLAFLVPSVDLLYNAKFLPRNGVGSLVISPTRELAMQIYDVLRNISAHVSQTFGLAVGGMNRANEAAKLVKGVNSLVGTPGRLLDHMQNTKGFLYHNLVCLAIDEADRILEVGFEEDLNMIIKLLPKKRQTALFSATQTRKVADLARLSLNKPVLVEVKTQDNVATVSGLTQGYVVCPAQSRFLLLFTFLKKNKDKKIMVFFSSCNSVKYHDELLNYIDVQVTSIHGHKKQASRSSTYYSFCAAEKGTLLCTDVAARGLDIPRVDWIVQYDPPDEPKEYIHRVGRTARGAQGIGKALLFLMPEELGFLHYLRKAGVPVSEYSFPPNKIANIQNQLERVIEKNYHLHRSSRDAYRSYMHAYVTHVHKDCFDVHKLDLQQVAKAFGFAHPPKVELNIKHSVRPKKKAPGNKSRPTERASGHAFSASNPYGVRAPDDKRQFVR